MAITVPKAKDPGELKEYGINWAPGLGDYTIIDSIFETMQGDAVVEDHTHTTTRTVVAVSGGVDGETCLIRNTVTTTGSLENNIMIEVLKLKIKINK